MPTYQYLCDGCGREFERFQSIKANALRKCPACGRMQLNRLIGTGGGIIFKGSGFYQTDYRSESYKAGEKDAKPETQAKGSDKKDTAKTDGSDSKKTTPKTPVKGQKEGSSE